MSRSQISNKIINLTPIKTKITNNVSETKTYKENSFFYSIQINEKSYIKEIIKDVLLDELCRISCPIGLINRQYELTLPGKFPQYHLLIINN